MASLKARVSAAVTRTREKHPFADHVAKLVAHYGKVNGNAQAGAVTFFGFLSFFPLLALAFFVVGQVSKVYDAKRELVTAIDSVLPGIVGNGDGELPLTTFEENAAAIGLIGLAGVLYAGLNWLSGMRDALEVMFELPKRDQPNFFVGKGRDLASLVVIGSVLIVSVGFSGLLTGFTRIVLDLVGLEETFVSTGLVWLIARVLGIAATTLLFLATFRLLVRPDVPRRSLVSGAVFGALAFEVLKLLAGFLLGSTKDQPAFQAFGIALILLVWINYFSRIVMLSAAWTHTSPAAVEVRSARNIHMPGAALSTRPEHGITRQDLAEERASDEPPPGSSAGAGTRRGSGRWVAVGALAGAVAAAGVLRRGGSA